MNLLSEPRSEWLRVETLESNIPSLLIPDKPAARSTARQNFLLLVFYVWGQYYHKN